MSNRLIARPSIITRHTRLAAVIVFCSYFQLLRGQPPIDIADVTIKVSPLKEKEFYYGFAEGDQVLLNFEENHERLIKSLEFCSESGNIIYSELDVERIRNKSLIIPATGIYKLRLKNSRLFSARKCWVKVQRVPAAEETRKFNSTVYTRTVYDTTYVEVKEEQLVQSDTIVSPLLNQTLKVHSKLNMNGSKEKIHFELPQNTISWAYYIGVDYQGQDAYSEAVKSLQKNPSRIVSKYTPTDPVGALALGFQSYLTQMFHGEDINYCLQDRDKSNFLVNNCLKEGLIINDFSKMEPTCQHLRFEFENDNVVTPVSVILKIVAIQIKSSWSIQLVKKPKLKARTEMYLKN
jgi:hypothetical protein